MRKAVITEVVEMDTNEYKLRTLDKRNYWNRKKRQKVGTVN